MIAAARPRAVKVTRSGSHHNLQSGRGLYVRPVQFSGPVAQTFKHPVHSHRVGRARLVRAHASDHLEHFSDSSVRILSVAELKARWLGYSQVRARLSVPRKYQCTVAVTSHM